MTSAKDAFLSGLKRCHPRPELFTAERQIRPQDEHTGPVKHGQKTGRPNDIDVREKQSQHPQGSLNRNDQREQGTGAKLQNRDGDERIENGNAHLLYQRPKHLIKAAYGKVPEHDNVLHYNLCGHGH